VSYRMLERGRGTRTMVVDTRVCRLCVRARARLVRELFCYARRGGEGKYGTPLCDYTCMPEGASAPTRRVLEARALASRRRRCRHHARPPKAPPAADEPCCTKIQKSDEEKKEWRYMRGKAGGHKGCRARARAPRGRRRRARRRSWMTAHRGLRGAMSVTVTRRRRGTTIRRRGVNGGPNTWARRQAQQAQAPAVPRLACRARRKIHLQA